MEQKRDLAIVLRAVPYEERHRVVTAITEHHGRISALARNSIQSRRFGGALEPFCASEWMFVERRGADLYRVEEAHVKRSFEGLRKDFERLALASIFNELMLKLAPEREDCNDLFRLHSNALATLEEMPGTGADITLLNAYLAKLLQWSGNHPQLQSCLECHVPLESYWSSRRAADGSAPKIENVSLSCVVTDAGWVCPNCRGKQTRHIRDREGQSFNRSLLRVTPAAVTDFFMSLASPIRQVPGLALGTKEEHQELFKFLEALFIYHVPGFDRVPLKSLRFLGLESSAQHP